MELTLESTCRCPQAGSKWGHGAVEHSEADLDLRFSLMSLFLKCPFFHEMSVGNQYIFNLFLVVHVKSITHL